MWKQTASSLSIAVELTIFEHSHRVCLLSFFHGEVFVGSIIMSFQLPVKTFGFLMSEFLLPSETRNLFGNYWEDLFVALLS